MSCSSRSMLILLAFVAAASRADAAGKPGPRPAAHRVRTAARHVSHSKTIRYGRPAVHRRPVERAPHRASRIVRRPVTRVIVRTVHRYPVRRVPRFYRRYYFRNFGYYRRYTHFYYPGRYRWWTSYYNRGYGRSPRYFSRAVRGIVEGVQGNAVNGTMLVKVMRPYSRRFRYGGAWAGAYGGSVHRFHVNTATRYEVLSIPRLPATFASLHPGEGVLIVKRGNQSNIAQKVDLFPWRRW
jgi:hypothetical protein